ncbi:nuclear transport factor 2 family protein [Stenotrophomonas sp. 24(2023)]|uniref:nuclear transport factor 2 family protein n=1 Tax=Stenotrophomonas sp. 24(2023) TaxID=3068324 RepID=UPI0027E047CE|nr:nuclear transport factor 2 family protein [Stenotrophomonas sp. 24(2023)]WMJ69031.1 nuclear transport factor 2 family protein [Stenotrophomonas sp. 24(2023)]
MVTNVDGLEAAQLQALEERLQRALVQGAAADIDAMLSPAFFVLDAQGEPLPVLPGWQAWRAGGVQVQGLDEQDVETLLCGRLALRTSTVRLQVRMEGRNLPPVQLRLLRVWACSACPAGAQLLSMTLILA